MPTVVHDFMPAPAIDQDVRFVRHALSIAYGGASQFGASQFGACLFGHINNGGLLSAHEPEAVAAEYGRQEAEEFPMLDAAVEAAAVLEALQALWGQV
jgi:hypothetical protein